MESKELVKELERQVKQSISKLEKERSINKKEKILVALSGGKDSATTAYLLKKLGYNIEGFHINLGIGKYSQECLEKIKELCDFIGIKLHVHDMQQKTGTSMCYLRSNIQSSKGKNSGLKNCAICGVIKKWIFNTEGKKLDAKKIATGHNLDDEAQTYLMNIFKGSPQLSSNLGPVSKNVQEARGKFIPRIKPLFFVPEEMIREYTKILEIPVNYDPCPCSFDSYRIQVRKFLSKMPDTDKRNIIKNFDKVSGKLNKIKDTNLSYCENCGEPCRGKTCKKCQLLDLKS